MSIIGKKSARAALMVIGALLLLSVIAVTAHAEEWQNWGVAPYASSQEEACKKAPAAIDGFDFPSAVKDHFKQSLGTTCKGGRETWLTPHTPIEQMWSGGKTPHVMNKITVGELPVLVSPNGRTYRKGAVAETVKTLSWTFVHEGKSYVLYLPFVCFNWSWAPGAAPHIASECVEFVFNAPAKGYVRWKIDPTTGLLSPSACNAQQQGDEPWTAWNGKCDDCAPDGVRHSYRYPTTARQQILRFSTEIWSKMLSICLEDAGGKQTCGVYMRPQDWQDWQDRHRVEIPDDLWWWDKECSG